MLKIVALLINAILIACELWTLGHIKKKWDILRYYTYLQNLLALIASLIFCVCLVAELISGTPVPEFAKGCRYIATSGLAATTFIFVVFLGAGKKAPMTQEDFSGGFSPKTANLILHYICPALSVVSFVALEREIGLDSGFWTGIVAIPSCLYWVVYIILSVTKAWEEPYQFESLEKKRPVLDSMPYVLMPLSFIVISFVLWNVK